MQEVIAQYISRKRKWHQIVYLPNYDRKYRNKFSIYFYPMFCLKLMPVYKHLLISNMRCTCMPSTLSKVNRPSCSFQKLLFDSILSMRCGVMMPCYELSKWLSYVTKSKYSIKRPFYLVLLGVEYFQSYFPYLRQRCLGENLFDYPPFLLFLTCWYKKLYLTTYRNLVDIWFSFAFDVSFSQSILLKLKSPIISL